MTATEQGATPRPITAEDLYRFTFVSDPQLSSDGRTVAFVRTTIDKEADAYRSQVWVVPADASRAARRFTGGPSDSAPRWSPDGRTLAFLRRIDGKAQIWLIGAAGGEAWQLTDAKEGVADPQWSPDGKSIAFASQVRAEDDQQRPASTDMVDVSALIGKKSDARVIDKLKYKLDGEGFYDDRRRHLFVVTVQGQGRGETRQITSGDYNEGQPAWSPGTPEGGCGSTLAFVSARHDERDRDNRGDVWTIAVHETDAQPQRVTRTTGPCANPSFSPDGYWIAYTGHDNSPDHGPSTITGLWLVPADGSAAPRNLAAGLDRPVGSGIGTDARYGVPAERLTWTPDGEILALVSDRGDVPLLRFDAETGESRVVLAGRRQITNVSASADGRVLAYAVSGGTQPADLFACDLDADGAATGERRLTDANGAFFAEVAIRTPQKYSYRTADGAELDAWVLTPPGFDPRRTYPLVLEIHGGPQALYGESFYHEFQMLAGQGYVVLYTNPRGSDGYGQGYRLQYAGSAPLCCGPNRLTAAPRH